jgi:hypothetical protein
MAEQRITRDELESQFAKFQADLQGKVDDKRQALITGGTVVLVLVLVMMFVLGKRSGRKSSTFLEIRRL